MRKKSPFNLLVSSVGVQIKALRTTSTHLDLSKCGLPMLDQKEMFMCLNEWDEVYERGGAFIIISKWGCFVTPESETRARLCAWLKDLINDHVDTAPLPIEQVHS